jgi:hypothetical protein
VSNLDEADFGLLLPERFHDAVDTIAGKSKDDIHAPLDKDIDQCVSRCHAHLQMNENRWKKAKRTKESAQ